MDSLRLKVDGCEDLWFDVQFPGQHNKFIFSVINRHPWNSLTTAFIESLDESLQKVNRKGDQVVITGDINIDLNPNNNYASRSNYLHMLESNAFSNLITKPTRVTENSQTIIDHLLTNDNESLINPGVLHYKLADHFPIFCLISLPKINSYQSTATNIFRNIKSIDVDKFYDDLESSLTPLTYDLIHFPLTPQSLNDNFNRLINTILDVIETHAPLQTASRRQKRLQKRPWITKGILISIKNKQKLYKTFFLGGSDFEKSFYKICANKLTRVKNLSKKLYYHSAIADRNSNPRES